MARNVLIALAVCLLAYAVYDPTNGGAAVKRVLLGLGAVAVGIGRAIGSLVS